MQLRRLVIKEQIATECAQSEQQHQRNETEPVIEDDLAETELPVQQNDWLIKAHQYVTDYQAAPLQRRNPANSSIDQVGKKGRPRRQQEHVVKDVRYRRDH